MTNLKIDYWDSAEKKQKQRDMTPAEIAQRNTDMSSAIAVPQKVARSQGLKALLLRGKLDQIPIEIAKIADPIQRRMAEIEFEESIEFERNNWLVLKIGQDLNLDLDDFFIFANTL